MTEVARMALVEQRLAEVSESLNDATGGAALCRIDGTGGSAKLRNGTGGSAKSLEGRMAALLEVRRTLRRDHDADLTGLAARWQSDLRARQANGSSAAWTDYLSGGADELARLLARTPGTAGPAPEVQGASRASATEVVP